MKCKKLLAIALTAAMFLSCGSGAFAAPVSESDTAPVVVESSAATESVSESETVASATKEADVSRNVAEHRALNDSATSGTCGDAMTWSYDTSTSVLTISGSGAMTSHPWDGYKNYISSIKFTGNISTICSYAFSNCNNIERVSIPDSVTSIGYSAFKDCKNLNGVVFSKNSNLTTINDYYDNSGYGIFQNCINLSAVVLPNKLTSIPRETFKGCTNIESVTIGNSVTSIGAGAFEKCYNLTSIIVPDSVEKIKEYTFFDCSSLSSVKLGSSLKTIDYKAFLGCSSLENITIPASVTYIGHSAFIGLKNLKTVTFEANSNLNTLGDYYDNSGYGVFQNCENLSKIVLPDNLTNIPRETFKCCTNLESIKIGKSVKTIGAGVFEKCYKLTEVEVSDSVETMGEYAFFDCANLSSVKLGKSLKSIGFKAFLGCNSLSSITIPTSVTFIGHSAFINLKNLKTVTFEANSNLTTLGDYYGNSGYGIFQNCSGIRSIVLPDKLTGIPRDTFAGCTGLESVTVGKHVVTVSRYAFNGCTSLNTVILPVALNSIGDHAFNDCSALNTVKYTGSESRWNTLKSDGISTEGNSYLLNAPNFVYNYAPGLTSISVKTKPSKLIYTVGETLDTEGLVLNANYEDGSAQEIDYDFTCSPTALNTVGDNQTITVTYKGKTATFKVNVNPVIKITTQPQNITVAAGGSATFKVVATGKGLKYQWYFKKSGQTSWTKWNGHTTASTTATAGDSWNKMQVRCVVSDTAGKSVTSGAATVTLAAMTASVTASPSTSVVEDASITFKCTAAGTGLTYQWQYKKSGQTSWTNWNGRTTASTTATANTTWNGMQVRCVVKNSAGKTVNSNALTLKISAKVKITQQPANVSAKVGDTAKFTVKATGTGTLTYQWYYKKSGQTAWNLWKGHTTASTSGTVGDTWNGMQVYCKVKDANGAVNSSAATVTLIVPLTITSQPSNITVADGQSVSFTVKAKGTGPLKYQWYFKKTGGSWTKWNGHTTATTSATANSSWNGMKVYCIVSDATGSTAPSNPATITVKKAPTITQQPKNITLYSGKTATFTVKATGTGTLKYQWYYKKSGQTAWTLWKDHTSASTSGVANDSWNKMQVRCKITDSNGSTTSAAATITIAAPLKITASPQNLVLSDGSTAKFTVKATGTGLKYQWYIKKSGASWKAWSGHTTASTSGTANSTWDEMQVRCLVTDATGGKVYSGIATVYVM